MISQSPQLGPKPRNLCCTARFHPSCIRLGSDQDAARSKVSEYRFKHVFHLHLAHEPVYRRRAELCHCPVSTLFYHPPPSLLDPQRNLEIWNSQPACGKQMGCIATTLASNDVNCGWVSHTPFQSEAPCKLQRCRDILGCLDPGLGGDNPASP